MVAAGHKHKQHYWMMYTYSTFKSEQVHIGPFSIQPCSVFENIANPSKTIYYSDKHVVIVGVFWYKDNIQYPTFEEQLQEKIKEVTLMPNIIENIDKVINE